MMQGQYCESMMPRLPLLLLVIANVCTHTQGKDRTAVTNKANKLDRDIGGAA